MNALIVTVVGAGSTYTPEMIDGFIQRHRVLQVAEFRLVDIHPEKLAIVGAMAQRMAAKAGLPARFVQTTDLESALPGSDFVLTQIRVGGLAARILDEKIPLKHGLIGQETTGIGGFFKALRTIPVLMNLARSMERLCPRAFLINFTNPAGLVTEALANHSTIRTLGLCNVPYHMIREARERVPEGARNLEVGYLGLNHLSWVTSIRADGVEYLADQLGGQYSLFKPKNNPDVEFTPELLKRVGAIPSSYLTYFYSPRAVLAQLKASPRSRGEVCQDIEKELLVLYQDPNLAEKPAVLEERGGAYYSEVAVSLIDAIVNDRSQTHVVNVQNRGCLGFLEDSDVVEVPCLVGRDGAVPLPQAGFRRPHIEGLMRQVKVYETLAVKAALTGDRDTALLALMAHPLVGDADVASACFDELLEAHRVWLPQFHD